MKVQVGKRPEMTIVGPVAVSEKADSALICKLWDSFEGYSEAIKHKQPDVWYELHIDDGNCHYCLTGIEVAKVEDLPLHCFAKTIPAGEYAVFSHKISQGGFPAAYRQIKQWLEENGYGGAKSHKLFEVQVYDHRFKDMDDPDSEIDFLIPLF